jgi:carbamoyl-phosphate synthase large subunit
MAVNVLFTSAGRRVELLSLFRTAYRSLNLEGHIVAVDIDPLAPALQSADRIYIVPRLDDQTYVPALVEICQREAVKLVLPLIDPDIPVLARARRELESVGARALVVSPEAANTAADKWETFKFFQELGLPTPKSWLAEDPTLSAAQFPLFVKPRCGSAGKNAFKVKDREELNFFLRYVPNPIVQEFIDGDEITSDVVCDLRGEVMAVVSRRRLEVRWGEVAKGVTVHNPQITGACVCIARALRAVGPLTVQCMVKAGELCFTEINARVGGGAPLGVFAGANWPRWLLAQAAGLDEPVPPATPYKVGLYISRFDDSVFLTEAQCEEMASHRV